MRNLLGHQEKGLYLQGEGAQRQPCISALCPAHWEEQGQLHEPAGKPALSQCYISHEEIFHVGDVRKWLFATPQLRGFIWTRVSNARGTDGGKREEGLRSWHWCVDVFSDKVIPVGRGEVCRTSVQRSS